MSEANTFPDEPKQPEKQDAFFLARAAMLARLAATADLPVYVCRVRERGSEATLLQTRIPGFGREDVTIAETLLSEDKLPPTEETPL